MSIVSDNRDNGKEIVHMYMQKNISGRNTYVANDYKDRAYFVYASRYSSCGRQMITSSIPSQKIVTKEIREEILVET